MIDISILISGISLFVAAVVAVVNIRHSYGDNDKQSASQITTLIVKLETISEGINEIKSEIRNVKDDVQDLRDRLIIVEQSVKSAHHRIDRFSESDDK